MPKECDTLTVIEEPTPDIKVIDAEITSPADKTIYPGGTFEFTVSVHNYGDAAGDVNVKLTYDGVEFPGSPVTITNVAAGADKSETYELPGMSSTGTYDICAEEMS